ncbi:MAG: sel1 repeat family protein [Oceanospirillales bacterium]|nr:sel1 repeat family protein [Oceanospirillales bacterium]
MRRIPTYLPLLIAIGSSLAIADSDTSDLSYESYINSDKRLKCLYGYVADKTGNHEAAIKIFEDCIERWNDVYSMIWLAQIYESGVGVPRDLAYSTALMKRGAHTQDEAGYSTLARYHYGVALYEGRGVEQNRQEGIKWLRQAAAEGMEEAADYLEKVGASSH